MTRTASNNRRRRPALSSALVTSAKAAAALYSTYYLASWVWKKFSKPDDDSDDDRNNLDAAALVNERSRRIAKCQREAIGAMSDFIPTLEKAVDNCTDCSVEFKALKKIRRSRRQLLGSGSVPTAAEQQDQQEEEKRLWEVIKVQTLTKLMATVYAHSILFLVLNVQVHLLGQRLYVHDTDSATDDGQDDMTKSHQIVLRQTYSYFFDQGIPALCQTLHKAFTHSLSKSWDITDTSTLEMTLDQFTFGIHAVRSYMEKRQSATYAMSTNGTTTSSSNHNGAFTILLSFLVNDDKNDIADNALDDHADLSLSSTPYHHDAAANYILDQTWDVLESPVFNKALEDSLDVTFHRLKTHHWQPMFQRGNRSGHSANSSSNSSVQNQQQPTLPQQIQCENASDLKLPLVHIITQLKYSSGSFFLVDNNNNSDRNPEIRSRPISDGAENNNEYLPLIKRLLSLLDVGHLCFGLH